LSLDLLAPAWLWMAAVLGLVALLHLMQSRWKSRVVGSLILWKRVAARGLELRARRPTLDLALLLGLAGAAVLVLAAAGPRAVTAARQGREMVIVLDNGTASLTRSPDGETRLDEAKALARAELASLEGGVRAAVVATSPSPRIVAPMGEPSDARALLGRAVRPCQVTGSLSAAVSLALAQGGARAETVVFTSRALPPSPARVRRVPVGRESTNIGIIHADFSDSRAFVALRNFAERPADVRVLLRAVDPASRELADRAVELAPLGRADVVLAPGGEAAEALAAARAVAVEMSSPADGPAADDLVADNIAFAARAGRGARRVGVVGDAGEPFLRALWAARVETVALAGGAVPEDMREDIDALVYFAKVPPSWPPPLPAILVAPGESVGPIQVLDDELRDVRGIFVAGKDRGTPTRGFPPGGVAVKRAMRVRVLGSAEPLIESDGELLAAGIAGGGARVVYLGFRPEDSDWPRRASFPVFVARVMEAFGSRGDGKGRLRFARVGDSAARHLPPGVKEARLPGGASVPRDGRLLEAGLYRAGAAHLAVGLVSEVESDNRLAPISPPSGAPMSSPPDTSRQGLSAWQLAGALVCLGLAMLAAEWLVSSRRS